MLVLFIFYKKCIDYLFINTVIGDYIMNIRIPVQWSGLIVLLLALSSSGLWAEENKPTVTTKSSSETSASDPNKHDKVQENVNQKRKKIIKEAVNAIEETKKALTALEHDKKQDALNALERAVGEIEVVLSREPNLAFVAIDTRVSIHDLYASLEDVKRAKNQVEDFLENNEIQNARRVLRDLASEAVVSVISIPLATYPQAIKDVVPLIDAGKVKEAKTALQIALNSLVVTDYIIPLPFIRAEENLIAAESLAEKKDRTEKDNTSLALLLENTRFQLNMAKVLGYSDKEKYELMHKQLDEIATKTEGSKYGSGYFNEIRKFLSELVSPLTEND